MTFTILLFSFFFFNDTATTEIYTLSLHDALPISSFGGLNRRRVRKWWRAYGLIHHGRAAGDCARRRALLRDRESTRLNSSHLVISYAGFCFKKKNKNVHCLLSTHHTSSLQAFKLC